MFPHGLGGRLSILFGEAVNDPGVHRHSPAARQVVGFASQNAQLILEVCQGPHKMLIAGRLSKHRMESGVFLDVTLFFFGTVMLFVDFHTVPEALQELRGQPCDENGMGFECFAEVVQVRDLRLGIEAQVGAAARLDPDEALGFQTIQRFTDRRLADPQLLRQVLFCEAAARVQMPFENVVSDVAMCQRGQILGDP